MMVTGQGIVDRTGGRTYSAKFRVARRAPHFATGKLPNEISRNINAARSIWGSLSPVVLKTLREITQKYRLSVHRGELTIVDRRLYVTHAGLLQIGHRRRCLGIITKLQTNLCDPAAGRWVFRATVFKSPSSKGFVGYGDADPSNTSALVRGAELRVAETRAVNRALRKAYGIGLCSVEELGSIPAQDNSKSALPKANGNANVKPASNGQPRLRDQLCLLIRQHSLDPTLVKSYAADFCGATNLRDANRDLIESFITHLAAQAKADRDALICKLNSYASAEAKP